MQQTDRSYDEMISSACDPELIESDYDEKGNYIGGQKKTDEEEVN